MNSILKATQLTKIYGDPNSANRVIALQNASLDLMPGEVVSIMGPSGSGKTTLISILGCILKPSSGELWIDGRAVTNLSEKELPEIRRNYIGFVFQAYNLFRSLTVQENVELALQLKGTEDALLSAKASDLLEVVGLSHRKNFSPADISGGEKQRVAIARALAGDPPIILADEPTANLDSRTGGDILELFQFLSVKRGKSVVIVTHDPRIKKIQHRPVLIEDGRIRETVYA
jgi:putative ABC transport system ATP-binding protein